MALVPSKQNQRFQWTSPPLSNTLHSEGLLPVPAPTAFHGHSWASPRPSDPHSESAKGRTPIRALRKMPQAPYEPLKKHTHCVDFHVCARAPEPPCFRAKAPCSCAKIPCSAKPSSVFFGLSRLIVAAFARRPRRDGAIPAPRRRQVCCARCRRLCAARPLKVFHRLRCEIVVGSRISCYICSFRGKAPDDRFGKTPLHAPGAFARRPRAAP